MEISVTFHGMDHGQYFQGHSPNKRFTETATGIGDSYSEAVNDALEQLASNGIDVTDPVLNQALKSECGLDREQLEMQMDLDSQELHSECDQNDDECELHFYVSIDVKP